MSMFVTPPLDWVHTWWSLHPGCSRHATKSAPACRVLKLKSALSSFLALCAQLGRGSAVQEPHAEKTVAANSDVTGKLVHASAAGPGTLA